MKYLDACPALAKALHDGATCLRLPVEPQPAFDGDPDAIVDYKATTGRPVTFRERRNEDLLAKSPYQPGDTLAVREPWVWKYSPLESLINEPCYILYDRLHGDRLGTACTAPSGEPKTARPASTMPDWAIRLRFTVKAVRVERLHDAGPRRLLDECGIDNGHAAMSQAQAIADWWNARTFDDGTPYPKFDTNPWTWLFDLERKGDLLKKRIDKVNLELDEAIAKTDAMEEGNA